MEKGKFTPRINGAGAPRIPGVEGPVAKGQLEGKEGRLGSGVEARPGKITLPPGMSPHTDDHGGVETPISYRFSLLPLAGLIAAAETMGEGEAKGRDNQGWRSIPIDRILDHAMGHIIAYLAGDREEDHLAHAICRVMMARDLEEEN